MCVNHDVLIPIVCPSPGQIVKFAMPGHTYTKNVLFSMYFNVFIRFSCQSKKTYNKYSTQVILKVL